MLALLPTLLTTLLANLSSSEPSVQPESQDGLWGKLLVQPDRVPMGDRIVFWLNLSFDSTLAAPKTGLLNRHAGSYELVFTDRKTGAIFHRTPFKGGLLFTGRPEAALPLRGGRRLDPEEEWVHLLSEQGEQIPPGTYEVRSIYVNTGERGVEAYTDSLTKRQNWRSYTGPWEFWKGRLESSPYFLTVLPAPVESLEVQVPSKMLMKTSIGIGWACAQDSMKTIRVIKEPGFTLGKRWVLYALSKGPDNPILKGLSDSWPKGWQFLPDSMTDGLLGETLVLDMELFESSVHPRHLWKPEQGLYKVLWTGQLRKSLSAP